MVIDDSSELYEWSQEDKDAFYNALDDVDVLLHSNGIPQAEIDDLFSNFMEQKRSERVPPEKVLDRLTNAAQKRSA